VVVKSICRDRLCFDIYRDREVGTGRVQNAWLNGKDIRAGKSKVLTINFRVGLSDVFVVTTSYLAR
jgi:hypothetical protein